MIILVVNAGSSSLKYQLFDMDEKKVIAKGLVERIGIEGSKLAQTVNGEKHIVTAPMKDHVDACQYMLDALTDKQVGVISNMSEISAVGHRVVHGGEKFTASVIIDDEVIAAIEENIPLGPLHNPANLMGIQACQQVMPNTPMVAVFDTAFHQTMPPKAFLYGIPLDYYKRLRVRRYGFHGTSHGYVSDRAAKMLNRPKEELRIITCHLGNGSSISAVDKGKCVSTSMGMTPLDGLLMGTRCGSLDAAVLPFIMEHDNIDIDTMMDILNKKSGLLGVSGVSSDMRDVEVAAAEGNEYAQISLDMLFDGIKKYIGGYAAIMGGVDAIVFTAGIGENGWELREKVIDGLEFMGAKLDHAKNNMRGKELDVSAEDSKVRVLVIPTNEELVIALDTKALVGLIA